MDTSALKDYAPRARREFIAAVTDRAAFHGLTAAKIEPVVEQGDVAIIGSRAFPRDAAVKRQRLEERIKRDGFEQVMEAMAYTWFNRFVAIRFMELHGYLDHGYRVLSHPEGKKTPEILDHATDVDLPGLDRARAVELKLDGTQDEELYRLLLKTQCNALHQAMPFLFERIGDETELLLPANLLHTDSLIRQLVEGIDESAWEEIEIIGWLYQFYISEKKDQVIGKVVKSEDIPAATQLFTPNWIVKYMVQNSLGAQWLATYPHSPLKGQMEYYIEPAEQTDEVKAELQAITPSTINPEELTLIDPASGSGHILVEAYDLFKGIYLERGYRQRDVAQLILEKNLFGLDIDERAAQLTGFALMMKGRADDRRLFERGVKLNVMALVDSTGFDAERLAQGVKLADYGLQPSDLTELKRLFEHATTFGSLIQVPEGLAAKLPALKQLSEASSPDLFVSEALKRLGPLVRQAALLGAQYDAAVANPPYMGARSFNSRLKSWMKESYGGVDRDLFSAFILRILALTRDAGHSGIMTSFVWMFISSFERLRREIISLHTLNSLVQLHYDAFADAKAHVCTFVLQRANVDGYKASFVRLADFPGVDAQGPKTLEAIGRRDCGWFFEGAPDEFNKIPGSPLAYWASAKVLNAFSLNPSLAEVAEPKVGLQTGDNDLFLRQWWEVSALGIGFGSKDTIEAASLGARWIPCVKGGSYRKWYGNLQFIVDWLDEGSAIRSHPGSYIRNEKYYFRPGITWSTITSSSFSMRRFPAGFLFETKGSVLFPKREDNEAYLLAYMNTKLVNHLLKMVSPTLDYHEGPLGRIPCIETPIARAGAISGLCSRVAKDDWDSYERSWDFQSLPILTASPDPTPTLESSYTAWITQNRDTIAEMKRLEEENNRLFIDAYGLADELTPDVPIEQITLTVNPAYRYGDKLTEEEQWTRFRRDTMEELVCYSIGCMMGRYSLDAPGLIYAHCGNEGFDPSRYVTFPADDDGIIPITDFARFADDVPTRFEKFVATAWPKEHLEENLKFVAESLGPNKGEAPPDTIRRYLATGCFKQHLQMYKKRPIYWLFSSGKQRAFQCLVYLHRYNEGTLARMRTEYVIPLQGMISSRIEQLDGDINAAASTAHRKKLEKERGTLVKQRTELEEFDEKLRHYADQRISLDLDDGVKVNYGKFSDLPAEVKAVTGSSED